MIKLFLNIPPILYRLAFIIAILGISYLATAPSSGQPSAFLYSDKLNHFIAFFTLAFLIDFSYLKESKVFKFEFLVGFGLAIEVCQSFLPHREFSWIDLLMDSFAIASYFLLAVILTRRTQTS